MIFGRKKQQANPSEPEDIDDELDDTEVDDDLDEDDEDTSAESPDDDEDVYDDDH